MPIKSDKWIRRMCEQHRMIDPFEAGQVRDGVISYGLSSYGYDIRVSNEFKVFTNVHNAIVDPKRFDERSFVNVDGPECVIPPNSFALARTEEYFRIPRDVLVVCVGKSTYARCFSGDTRVALVDGSAPTLEEMAERYQRGERFRGYALGASGRIEAAALEAPRFIARDTLLEITLNNGRTIRATPDHEFIRRDGRRAQADDLRPGDPLMPLQRKVVRGREAVCQPFVEAGRAPRVPAWRQAPCESDGLAWRPAGTAARPAGAAAWSTGVADWTSGVAAGASGVAAWPAGGGAGTSGAASWPAGPPNLRRPSCTNFALEGVDFSSAKFGAVYAHDFPLDHPAIIERESGGVWRAQLHSEKKKGTECASRAVRRLGGARPGPAPRARDLEVASIRSLRGDHDVYCLTVPGAGNFALDAGVFVGNCGLIVNVTPLEPTWEGYLTLEISNTTPLPAKVYGGEGIAQLLFFEGDEEPEVAYADRKGKYMKQVGVTLPKM